MENHVKKRSSLWLFIVALLLVAGVAAGSKPLQVQAASQYYNKLVWNDAHTERYYYNSSGQKVKSAWVTVGKYKYYLDKNGCVVLNDWLKSGDTYYYANQNGAIYENRQVLIDGKYYYFGNGGAMHKGWLEKGSTWYFYSRENGARVKSWQTIDERKYYFYSNGRMAVGWVKSSVGNYYYFEEETTSKVKEGQLHTSWLTYNGRKYYMRPSNGMMVKDGTYSIGGKEYTFDKYGVLNGNESVKDPEYTPGSGQLTPGPTTAKTLKNFMLSAMQPVGQCLYVWGGGHGTTDATRKGVSPAWASFYNSQSSSYQYSTNADTTKGLDCSGYVGWAVYNALNTKSGGSYVTGVSGTMIGDYVSRGWGSQITQEYLSKNNYTVRCGDIGGHSSHIWIILGQCKDRSAVILHSTPNAGVQIAGTPVPTTGNYNSQAIALAQKYMSKYSGFSKYSYRPSSSNYIRQAPYFRWDLEDGPLSDPDGYSKMTADEILKDIFGY